MKASISTKRPPHPCGELKHCWGRRRRLYKKTEKALWKAMYRLGLLRKERVGTDDSFWEQRTLDNCNRWFNEPGRKTKRRKKVPEIRHGWTDYWGEGGCAPARTIGRNHADAPAWDTYDYDEADGEWPKLIAKSDRHLLKLLRAELRTGVRAGAATESGEKGGA